MEAFLGWFGVTAAVVIIIFLYEIKNILKDDNYYCPNCSCKKCQNDIDEADSWKYR